MEILAPDGAVLGVASSSPSATDGVCNTLSPYGSITSTTSIYNSSGPYGSKSSSLSAYDQSSTMPPLLFCATTQARYVSITKNTRLPYSVDPDTLCAFLAAHGY
jgi:hypothetical protein